MYLQRWTGQLAAFTGLAAALCLGSVMPSTTFAFQDEATSPPVATEPEAAEPVYPEPEISPEAVAKARAILLQSAQAYKRAVKMTDTVTIFAPDIFTNEPSEQTIELAFYGGTDAMVDLQGVGYRFVSVGDKAYGRYRNVPLQVAILDMKGDLAQTVMDPSGKGIYFPHFVFKRSSNIKDLEAAVTITLADPSIDGYHRAVIDGEDVHEIYARGSNGDLYITIDPETLFLKSLMVQYDPIEDPDPQKSFDGAVVVFEFAPKALQELDPPDVSVYDSIEFVKKRSVADLEPDPITVGDRLPRVPVPSVNGEYIRLCDDLTKINVLVYFVMDDVMSAATMEMVQELQGLITAEDLPVKITCINTLEGMDDAKEEWNSLLKTYIEENGFDFTFLVDHDAIGANNHNIGFIPSLLIADRNDILRRKYDRQGATNAQKMLADIRKLLDEPPGTVVEKPVRATETGHEGHNHK